MAPLSRIAILVFFAASSGLYGQSLQLKRVRKMTVVQYAGRSVTKLRGNVQLSGPEGVFTCDSADWYGNENRLFAYTNVRFGGRDGIVVRSRTLEYLNGESYFSGGVTVTDGDQSLVTSSLRYSTKERRGSFSQPAQVRTKDGNLTCRRGSFEAGTYRFTGDVRWTGDGEKLYGDQMEYSSKNRSASMPKGGSGTIEDDSVTF
ncbi:MAG: OstA-like protein, partial [Schleiferiaceae bacterium]